MGSGGEGGGGEKTPFEKKSWYPFDSTLGGSSSFELERVNHTRKLYFKRTNLTQYSLSRNQNTEKGNMEEHAQTK